MFSKKGELRAEQTGTGVISVRSPAICLAVHWACFLSHAAVCGWLGSCLAEPSGQSRYTGVILKVTLQGKTIKRPLTESYRRAHST